MKRVQISGRNREECNEAFKRAFEGHTPPVEFRTIEWNPEGVLIEVPDLDEVNAEGRIIEGLDRPSTPKEAG